jgi:hypothetical protein
LSSIQDEVDAQNRVALQTHRDLGAGWAVCEDIFVQLGGAGQIGGVIQTSDGQTVARPTPSFELFTAWDRLRSVMALPDKGTWFTGRLRLEHSGRYSFDFEWDEEPVWPTVVSAGGVIVSGSPVDRSALLEDLNRYERSSQYLPEWAARLPKETDVQFAEEKMPPELLRLTADPQWAAVLEGGHSYMRDVVIDGRAEFTSSEDLANLILADLLGYVEAQDLRSMLSTAQNLGLLPPANEFTAVDPQRLAQELTGHAPAGVQSLAFARLMNDLAEGIKESVLETSTS